MSEMDYFHSEYVAASARRLPDAFDVELHSARAELRVEVGLLHNFYLYMTNRCSYREQEPTIEEETEMGKICCFMRIEELLKGKTLLKRCLYREQYNKTGAVRKICFRIKELLEREWELTVFRLPPAKFERKLIHYRKAIKLLFEKKINEKVINYLSDYYWLEDPKVLLELIDKVLKDLERFHPAAISSFKTLKEKLKFLKCIISFARLYDQVGSQQFTDLLIHANRVTINACYLFSLCWFGRYDEEAASHGMQLQISRLIREKIDPPSHDHQETYIHVLTAGRLPSDILTLDQEEEHQVAEFIAGLLDVCTAIRFPITDQMGKFRKELLLLTITLKHHEEFIELYHELKNHIGAVFFDAAIVIFSISMNRSAEEVLGETTDSALFRLVKRLESFNRPEDAQLYPLKSVSGFGFPKTNELGSMDFLLQNLEELARCNEFNGLGVDKIKAVKEDLEFLRCLLEKIEEHRNQNVELQTFWSRAMELAYRVELVIDIKLVGDGREYCLDDIALDINRMKMEAQEIYGSTNYDARNRRLAKAYTRIPSHVPAKTDNEDLVGLEDEVKTITLRLTRGSMQLDIVPIVGMGGLGKTTLANTVYNAPLVVLHFHVRAWCTVSQAYSTRILLIQIFCSISSEYTEEKLKDMDEQDLASRLKQVLLRNRYLLVLDDIWDIEAWNLLVRSLPDDANGSRILITSRLQNLSLQFKPDSHSYHLRQLTDGESWELLQKRVFGKEGCPANLCGIGSQIAKSCRGLPLAVVLVAGILSATAEKCWEEVENSLNFSTVLDNEYCMNTLELSYNHLPNDLKQCLLYFSSFQEDSNILVQQLLWAWISEGFVRNTAEGKNLVDVADDYLKALVERSLVMASKERTMGGYKFCKLHDLVYEFCVEKAKEDNFLYRISSWKDVYASTCPSNYYRVSCTPQAEEMDIGDLLQFFPNLRSFRSSLDHGGSVRVSQLLRVLSIGYIKRTSFPVGVVSLVHLRYLALNIGETICIPSTIANLSRLQILLLKGFYMRCLLPRTIWNMNSLLALHNSCGVVFPVENLEESSSLDHLHSLCLAIDDSSSQCFPKILAKFPSIRKLCCINRTTEVPTGVLAFDCLSELVSLQLRGFEGYGFKLTLNLKKLTLSGNFQPCSEISVIAKLPNLEVLKLLRDSFDGETWEREEGDFPNLRFLKFEELQLCRWIFAFSDNLPYLQKLVVHSCRSLVELPSGLGECPNLEIIEVRRCRNSVASSVNQILEEQKDMGYQDLKIVIRNCYD